MKIRQITIHNFRSIKHSTLLLDDFSLAVGANNSGKTNVVLALRNFYEDGGVKYKKSFDFPKKEVGAEDEESWVEIEFTLDDDEHDNLKEEYKTPEKILKVRRYFESKDTDRVKPGQSNIYGYEGGVLSTNLFYGAKNVSQQKLGSVLYIPAVSKADDTMKLTGPSPFRDMLTLVMKRAVSESQTFTGLMTAFEQFNKKFKDESSKEGFSLNAVIKDVNESIAQWRVGFDVRINPVNPEQLIKNLLSHYFVDQELEGEEMDIGSYGQGLQRHLIFTLIRLAGKYKAPRASKKKEFNPDYTLMLFEEPEAFLHPGQQESLHRSLRELAAEPTQQVLVTTHSPHYVSRQISDLTGLIRLQKSGARSESFQLMNSDLESLLDQNVGLYREFCKALKNPEIDNSIKGAIRARKLGDDNPDDVKRIEDEGIRYFLSLDAERSGLFFAKHVVICEGASEKALLSVLADERWKQLQDRHIYYLDSIGKFNIHRYMGLLSALGIENSVLMDGDGDVGIQKITNEFIENNKGVRTKYLHIFEMDFEGFLGIDREERRDLKALNAVVRYKRGEIEVEQVLALEAIIRKCVGDDEFLGQENTLSSGQSIGG